jgi:hypothetical protein
MRPVSGCILGARLWPCRWRPFGRCCRLELYRGIASAMPSKAGLYQDTPSGVPRVPRYQMRLQALRLPGDSVLSGTSKQNQKRRTGVSAPHKQRHLSWSASSSGPDCSRGSRPTLAKSAQGWGTLSWNGADNFKAKSEALDRSVCPHQKQNQGRRTGVSAPHRPRNVAPTCGQEPRANI